MLTFHTKKKETKTIDLKLEYLTLYEAKESMIIASIKLITTLFPGNTTINQQST